MCLVTRGAHPEFFQTSEMSEILYRWNVVSAYVQRRKFQLRMILEQRDKGCLEELYVMLESFYSRHSIVAQV
jgi:hypothetical protein